MRLRSALPVLVLLVVSACHSPPVPDFSYYRLPDPAPLPHAVVKPVPMIVVEPFSAEGFYADQAMIHALDPAANELRQYHYALWIASPGTMLQRRLIGQLRDTGAARLVTGELPASAPALRIHGTVLRFERVPVAGGGFRAHVELALRIVAPDGNLLSDRRYAADAPAAGTSLAASVAAAGQAVDRVFAEFWPELERTERTADAH